jgi:hypothetical protein
MGRCVSPRPTCAAGQTDCAPTAPAPNCVDLQSNAMNCGACATACVGGQSCVMGSCVCAGGTTLCGRTCVNTQTDASHCGGCGSACPMGQVCNAGVCGCPAGQALCGGLCVNTQSDSNNCGACGAACPTGQVCSSGRCGCPAGRSLCGAPQTCVDVQTDRAHCGACDNACPMGQGVRCGTLRLPFGGSLCAGRPRAAWTRRRTRITAARATTCACRGQAAWPVLVADCRLPTTRAPERSRSTSRCRLRRGRSTRAPRATTRAARAGCSSGNDVFYRFTLTQPSIVYADTLGSSFDTSLFLQTMAGTNVSASTGGVACNDDVASAGFCSGLSGLQSMIATRLDAGTYFLVLSGCGAGAATVRFQHVPAGAGAATRVTPTTTTAQTATGTTGATSGYSGDCCSSGGDASLWWITCPEHRRCPLLCVDVQPEHGGSTALDTTARSRSTARRARARRRATTTLVLCARRARPSPPRSPRQERTSSRSTAS